MTLLPGMHSIAQNSALTMVDSLIEGTVVALFAGVFARVSFRENSSARFLLWFSALIGIALLPLLSALRPAGAASSSAASHTAITLPGSAAIYLFAGWGAVAALLLLRVAIGVLRLRSLRNSFVPVDLERVDSSIREVLQRGRGEHPVLLCSSDRVQVPAAIGFSDPTVVLPNWALEEMSMDELQQILLHELAHLRRRDDWTNLAQRIIKALFFFHPAVWWIERKISLEREIACDDAVLLETQQPRAYAECLAHMAEKTLVQRSLYLAQAALGRVRQTSLRVAQILNGKRHRGKAQSWRIAFSATGLVLVCGLVGVNEPRVVAFENTGASASEPVLASNSQVVRTSHVNPEFLRPASFKVRKEKHNATSELRRAEVVTKTLITSNRPTTPRTEAPLSIRASSFSSTLGEIDPGFVHFAAAAFQTDASGTAFLLIEKSYSNGAAQPVFYQIQFWKLAVMPIPPAQNRVVRKQT